MLKRSSILIKSPTPAGRVWKRPISMFTFLVFRTIFDKDDNYKEGPFMNIVRALGMLSGSIYSTVDSIRASHNR